MKLTKAQNQAVSRWHSNRKKVVQLCESGEIDPTVQCSECGTSITYSPSYWWVLQREGRSDQVLCRRCSAFRRQEKIARSRYPGECEFEAPCGARAVLRCIGTGNPCWACGVYHADWYLTCLDRAATMDWPGWDVGKPDAD